MKTLMGRQPILDTKHQTIGYELLFRSFESDAIANFDDGNFATTQVIKNWLINFDIERLTGGKKVFINFTKDLILERMPLLLRKSSVVIEILEDIYDSEDVIEAIIELKNEGYLFAIDDFSYIEGKKRLFELSDIIKVDFLSYSTEEILKTAEMCKKFDKTLLAEKVEDQKTYEFAKEHGFTMFQGYYFLKPEVLETNTITTVPSSYIRLIEELNAEIVDYERLANIAKADTALTYSILKIVNSVAYYSRSRIKSLKDAFTRLGLREGRKIIYFNFLKSMSPMGTPGELIKKSLVRGKQAELLAKHFNLADNSEELFLLGMFSLINIILKNDMKTIVNKLPLDKKIIDALLGKRNDFTNVMDLIIINEKNKLNLLEMYLNNLNLSIDEFSDIYFHSVEWAEVIFD